MKKLLGMFLCLGLCMTLGFGTTGCTKKDDKDKTVKDKDKGEKDKAAKDKGDKDKDKGTKDKDKSETPPKIDPAPEVPKVKIDPAPEAPKDKAPKIDPAPEAPKDKAPKVEPIPEAPKGKVEAPKDKAPEDKGPKLDVSAPKLLLPKIDAPTKGVFLDRLTPVQQRRLEFVPVLNSRNSLVG